MRSDEERILEMHKRAEQIGHKNDVLRMWGTSAVLVAACIVVIVLAGLVIPLALNDTQSFTQDKSISASIFASGSALGFVVIGILAFFLGVSVTIFCYRMKRSRKV